MEPSQGAPSEVLTGVWLGGERFLSRDAWDNFAQKTGLGFVVTAGKELKGACSGVERLRVDVDDHEGEDLFRFFAGVCARLESARRNGDVVLVHCAAGISRSATLLAAWLMFRRNWSAEEAIEFLRRKRPIVNPNRGFRKQLVRWEEHLKVSRPQLQPAS